MPLGLVGVRAVSAGEYFTVALLQDGTVSVWGQASGADLTPPVTLGPVREIAAGSAGFVIAVMAPASTAACIADLDGDRIVNGPDLAALLAAWNVTGAQMPADLDRDGDVDGNDLSVLLAAWGSCG